MMERHDFDWRTEAGLVPGTYYKKCFALLPVTCTDNSAVWLENYYKKYKTWKGQLYRPPLTHDRTDKIYIETITESEYIVRKLSDNL